jgi:TolA-binding protein
MKESISNIEIIERYYDNELSEAEIAQLKERLKTDAELKNLFDQEKLLINTIRFRAAQSNLEFLKQVERSIESPGIGDTRRYWYYAAAACITLLIVAGLYFPFSSPEPDKLYADYFKPYRNSFEPNLRSDLAGVTNENAEAFRAYDAGDYQRAAVLFTEMQKQGSDPVVLLLLGNANLMIGKTEDAKQNFNDLIRQYDDLDIQAKWFLSLCYLKSGETVKARTLLKELGDTEISYATKAKELLKKVD